MKKKIVASLLVLLILTLTLSTMVTASPATSYTWTFNAKGNWTKTQDAYLPELTLIDLELDGPEDLFIDKDNQLYIADTGNSRILKYNIDKNAVELILDDKALKSPKGVYVTDDGNIYVADSKAEAVHRFDQDGTLIESFGRPDEIAFANTPYNPVRIAVDTKKNMYIIGEGVLNGIIHLSNSGQFLGYFASNKVTLDLVQELQEIFFTDEQLDNLGSRVPLTMTNVFVDQDNIVYSTTMGMQASHYLAKHNTEGKNIFTETRGASDFIDLFVDEDGIVYAASLEGTIGVYSTDGELIHIFGSFFGEEDISGLFTDLGSVAVDRDGKIWAADSSTSYIQSFRPTAYANLIYDALEAFKLGKYEEAEELWLDVLRQNQMLKLAHEGIGKVYLYTERYEEAMVHLKLANNKYFYSQAYWEVRNVWLQENLAGLLIGFVIFLVLFNFLKRMDRKYKIFEFYRAGVKNLRKIKWIDDLLFIFEFFKHPIDSYYDLKIGTRGSYLSASLLYLVFFAVYIHSSFGRGFLFRPVAIEDIDFLALTLGFFVIILLFVVTNYLITSIQDGDGTFGSIYKLTSYAMGPMILSTLAVTVLSYFISYNEEFLVDFIEFGAPIWSLIILILGLQEIHHYTTREAIKSIILSIAFMLIIAIILLIVVIMGEQVYDFFEVIVREVIRNVTR